MFDFVCECSVFIAFSQFYCGEYSRIRVFRKIFHYETGLPAIFMTCKVHTISCEKCLSLVGYYFIDCPLYLKELEGKYGLIATKSVKKMSFSHQNQETLALVHSLQDKFRKIEDHCLALEIGILKLSSVVIEIKK